MKLFLKNVRGFRDDHYLDVKPLTLVVGENSAGKTTLLAALHATLQTDFPNTSVFNRSPFELGSYETIATYRGGKYGRAESFWLGFEFEEQGASLAVEFAGNHGNVQVGQMRYKSRTTSLTGSLETGKWDLIHDEDGVRIEQPLETKPFGQVLGDNFLSLTLLNHFIPAVQALAAESKRAGAVAATNKLFHVLYELLSTVTALRPAVTAIAPLRSRPRRTYDELIEEPKPEGNHVPLVLARILQSDRARDKAVVASLEAFGKHSGLFSSLRVKRMGNRPSDPFQVRVKSSGPDANLVDVGYGVSQALPIVVDSLLAPGKLVLVQQPEVHLHPRAQAQLGTFFAWEAAKPDGKNFVIETHSDHLVDRVRMAVAEKVIRCDDVSIVFLDRRGLDVNIHTLRLDELGNIQNAPESYRKFFLEEETRLLFRGN